MLSGVVGHLAPPVVPGDVWSAWSRDPLAWLVLLGLLVVHERGWRAERAHPRLRWRRRAFLAATAVAALALVSPLDALSGSLASAHMVQHLLLTVVVAPLLVLSAPMGPLRRGLPRPVRLELHRLRRRSRLRPARLVYSHPIALAVLFAATLWTWHAAGPYELALRNDLVHRVEHGLFLATALASWAAVLLTARRRRASTGTSVLVLFGLSVQGSVLGALLTFARTPWYPAYGDRAAAWGISPMEDQQLAGVIMWVPGGLAYLAAGLAVTALWLASEQEPSAGALLIGTGPGTGASPDRTSRTRTWHDLADLASKGVNDRPDPSVSGAAAGHVEGLRRVGRREPSSPRMLIRDKRRSPATATDWPDRRT